MSATVSITVSGEHSVQLEYDNPDGEAVSQRVNPGQTWNVQLLDGDESGVHVALAPE